MMLRMDQYHHIWDTKMSTSFFSFFVWATGMLVIAMYYLFFNKAKNEGRKDYGKPVFYLLLFVSIIVFTSGLISIILAFTRGNTIAYSKPHTILFVMSALILLLSSYELIVRKKKWPEYSWFIPVFLLAYSSLIVVWGIISIV
jgi:hypothetical protein